MSKEMKKKDEIATRSPLYGLADRYHMEPTKIVEVLAATVIKVKGRKPTNEEIAVFCLVANHYGLNPFTREIHAFASETHGVVPIVGIDGWSRIVNSHTEFNGVQFDIEEGDDGKPSAVTCRMHVKGRDHPVEVTELYRECYRNTAPWNQMPHRMLRHKAFMQAARYAFSLSGLFDDDEARDVESGSGERPPIQMPRALDPVAEEPPANPEPKGDLYKDEEPHAYSK